MLRVLPGMVKLAKKVPWLSAWKGNSHCSHILFPQSLEWDCLLLTPRGVLDGTQLFGSNNRGTAIDCRELDEADTEGAGKVDALIFCLGFMKGK